MTQEEIDKLFELLLVFRPNDPRAKDKRLKSAWYLVLAPYKRDDVREAVAGYFREKSFWPDVTDIASRCHMPEDRTPTEDGLCRKDGECPRCVQPNVWEWWQAREKAKEYAGIPPLLKAFEDGMSIEEYMAMCDKAGIT